MNTTIKMYIGSLIRHGLVVLGALLVKHHFDQTALNAAMATIDPDAVAGALMVLAGLVWSGVQKNAHVAALTAALMPSKPRRDADGHIIPVLAALLCLAAVMTTGCTHFVIASGSAKVATRITVHQFGVNIGVTPANETPQITLGTSTVLVDFIPLSTNGVIYSPDLATTIEDDNNADPFEFSGTASVVSGHDASYKATATNAVTAQPIVPK
jgi:hypothetical protein